MRYPLLTFCLLAITTTAHAAWPARVFAPYMYIGAGDHFQLTDCNDACSLKYYTLAFIIARQHGTGKSLQYLPEPTWDGSMPMEQNVYKNQIDAIRKRGGDVILSFGGEAGRELAIIETDPTKLLALYQQIIDRYHFTWLDFDIEGSNLKKNPQANQRRNTVLAELQKQNPGLRITYTLPVDPDGISTASRALLTDASSNGLKVYSANLMVMFFGTKFIHKGKSEGELAIDSANKAHDQIQKIDPTIQIGLCPALGQNGSPQEIFSPADAQTLMTFAEKTSWVCSLHYWSINDDAGKKKNTHPWEFAKIFLPFTTH